MTQDTALVSQEGHPVLVPKNPKPMETPEPIDVDIVRLMRTATVPAIMSFTTEVKRKILDALAIGVPFERASYYAGIPPKTLNKWLEEGFNELSQITDEEIENGKELGDKAKFAYDCMRTKGEFSKDLMENLVERSKENGNSYLLLWLAERDMPDQFHLKKKVDTTVTKEVKNTAVVFHFVDGLNSRPENERNVIDAKMNELKERYGNE